LVPGQSPTWRQSILLNNGWQLTLHFRDVQVQEVQALIPTPLDGAAVVDAFALPHPSLE